MKNSHFKKNPNKFGLKVPIKKPNLVQWQKRPNKKNLLKSPWGIHSDPNTKHKPKVTKNIDPK